MLTTFVVCALFVAIPAAAQTTPPPTTQPPPTQTPPPQTPPAGQKPPALPTPPVPVPFPDGAKVAFISLQAIVSQSDLGKAGSKELQALTEAKQQQVSAKQKEVQGIQQKMQAQQTVMSAEAAANMNRELDRLQRELQFLQQQAQADIQSKNQELLESFTQKVLPIVEKIREDMGLWVIFAVQEDGGGLAVAATHKGLDLSMEVVKRLNAIAK
ncbi:MAG TPA: OmpH family outer membrane protein [Vicinamibacterales bacterium]|nr:OmpH family outer membrane protein [Vicinamibacterales bacterium]